MNTDQKDSLHIEEQNQENDDFEIFELDEMERPTLQHDQ